MHSELSKILTERPAQAAWSFNPEADSFRLLPSLRVSVSTSALYISKAFLCCPCEAKNSAIHLSSVIGAVLLSPLLLCDLFMTIHPVCACPCLLHKAFALHSVHEFAFAARVTDESRVSSSIKIQRFRRNLGTQNGSRSLRAFRDFALRLGTFIK